MSDTLKQALHKLMDNGEQIYSLVCKVNSVDETKRTCDVTPINDDADILDTRLQASLNSTAGIVQFPKVNTNVIVTFLTKDVGFVSLCTDVDKILIECDKVIFNGGNKGAMVKIDDVLSAINRLENTFNAHVHPVPSLGTSLIPTVPIAPPTTLADLANNEIKQ